MISNLVFMDGNGIYVWSAFSFTLISFVALYTVIKIQLVKEQIKFNAKFVTLTSDKIQSAKVQATYREILANTSISKI